MRELSEESRLWLAVLLLVLAEREERFVKIKHRNSERDRRARQGIAEGARSFVSSVDFATLCGIFGFNPEVLRARTPEECYRGYQKLMSDDVAMEEDQWQ